MDKLGLSKSKYCRAVQCRKILWLDKNKPECAEKVTNDSILENGVKVGELARELFGNYININYEQELSKMVEETKKYLNNFPNVITEASFEYNGNFCSIDILKNYENGLEVYEVKSSTEVKDIYLDDIAYQVYILLNNGFNVNKACIVHINNGYVRHGELELNKLFIIEDVTNIALEKQPGIEKRIEEIKEYMNNSSEPNQDIGMQCNNPYDCAYWKYCTRNLPENNVFSIRNMKRSKKFDLYYSGIVDFHDLLNTNINDKYKEQIEYQLYSKEDKIDKEKIKDFLNKLYYPLYFLDFETFEQAIPQYDGIRPYMQIPFQYSLHYIEKEEGILNHKEFLAEAGEDPRRKLAERLVQDIPKNACVLAYNMGFEKSVIKNLAGLFEDLKEELMSIYYNIQDLMFPFQNRFYYNKEMQGSYSIKYVLPALFPHDEELNYHNLPVVHNGSEAMSTFATLGEKSKEEQNIIRHGLLEYCKLDTLAMVKIWEKLLDVTK